MDGTPGTDRWRGLARAWPAAALAVALVAYGVSLWREKWISDDGYIYLAYVKNLFEHGELAFNLGERVDAATGFAWLLALVAGRAVLFFLDLRQVTFVLSWICALAAFWLLARRVLAGERRFLVAIAVLFFTRFVVSFSTSGLETPLILLLSVMVYDAGRDRLRSPRTAALLGAAPFIRPELGLLLLVYAGFLLRPPAGRALAAAAGSAAAFALGRWLCFGDVIPNTAFVKLLSPTFDQGRRYAFEFAASYPHVDLVLIAFAAMAAWFAWSILRHRRLPAPAGRHHLFALISALLLVAYVWASGGDFMHGRFFLAPFVLAILLVVDLGPRLVALRPPRGGSAALLAGAAALAVAGVLTPPYSTRQPDSYYARITDEQQAYAEFNPRLTAWSGSNPHRWAEDGRRLDRLAVRVGRPVGATAGGIGQVRFYADAERVYVFDDLALTNVAGSMLDTHGYFRRIGHNALVPRPLRVLEPRLTLFDVPDKRLGQLLAFRFERTAFTLGALVDVDTYVAAGLLPADSWARIDQRIGDLLSADWLDRNTVFYLRHRYPADRPLFRRIRRAYEELAADGATSWITWYERQKPLIEAARAIQRGERAALPARYRLLVAAGSARPIESTYQTSSWLVRGGRRPCRLDFARVPVTVESGLALDWRPGEGDAVLVLDNQRGGQRSAAFDLRAAVAAQCAGAVESVILDWEMKEVTGAAARTFAVQPLGEEHNFYTPGSPLRLSPREAAPLGLSVPVTGGQRLVLSLAATAVLVAPRGAVKPRSRAPAPPTPSTPSPPSSESR